MVNLTILYIHQFLLVRFIVDAFIFRHSSNQNYVFKVSLFLACLENLGLFVFHVTTLEILVFLKWMNKLYSNPIRQISNEFARVCCKWCY